MVDIQEVEAPAPEKQALSENQEKRQEKRRGLRAAIGGLGAAALVASGIFIGSVIGKETTAATLPPTETSAPLVPGSTAPSVPETTVPQVTVPETTLPTVEAVGPFVIENKPTKLRGYYDTIDWKNRETILATAPPPLYVKYSKNKIIDAQEVVDAVYYNYSLWLATGDEKFVSPIYGILDYYDDSYYQKNVAPYYAVGGEALKIQDWGVALSIEEEGDGLYRISGEKVTYRQEIGITVVFIREFFLVVGLSDEKGSSYFFVRDWEEGERFFERLNMVDDTAFELSRGSEVEEIVLPWAGPKIEH